jgi:hypothetical protein
MPTDLKLSYLGVAVGANAGTAENTKLGADCLGSTGTETKMSDYAIDGVASVSLPTNNPNENASYVATVAFTNAGSSFISRIGSNSANFDWQEHSGNTWWSYPNGTGWGVNDYTANLSMGTVSTNQSATLKMRFIDYYNSGVTNYNTYLYDSFTIINGNIRSDSRWKQNIERVGTSQLGLPIFEFEYIDSTHGKGRFRGTIAQELIKNDYAHATILDDDGYYLVDYNKIDIIFESC